MSWQKRIEDGAGFGTVDKVFAGHLSDEKTAKEVIAEAKNEGATFEEFEKELVYYVYKHVTAQGLLEKHLAKTVDKAKTLW